MGIKEKFDNFSKTVVDKIDELGKEVRESEAYANLTNKIFNDEYRALKERTLEKIEEYDTIIIHRHTRPDGDAIGSALGLRDTLRNKYPNKNIYAVGDPLPEYLKFVGRQDNIEDSVYENALMIVVDTATKDRINQDKTALAKEVIKIDHHIAVDDYGTINYVRENYASCSLVLVDFFETMGINIPITAARYLYIATITDTGRFRYKEVDANALRLSSLLLEKGIDTEEIFSNLYSKDKSVYKLQGYVYNHVKYTENGVAYLFMTKRLMKKFKVNVEDASNTVNLMDGIEGSLIWLLFVEYDNEIRIRLRSRFVGVVGIANKYNGGGHEFAAGGTIHSKKEIKNVLAYADKVLHEYKLENKDKF